MNLQGCTVGKSLHVDYVHATCIHGEFAFLWADEQGYFAIRRCIDTGYGK